MYLEKIETSFNNSSLSLQSDKLDFMLCLKHLNYINSEDSIKQIIKNIAELNLINPEDDVKNIWKITSTHIFKGLLHSKNTRFYSLHKTSRFNLEEVQPFIEYLNLVNNTEMICEYFKETFERTISEERMIWLTDEKISDVKELIMKLGLYHMETVTEKDSFFLFEFEVDKYFKPTWIDSGFVFYFNSQKEHNEYGLTLNLEDGLDGLKEFITKRGNIKLKNISVLYPSKIVKAHNLSNTFWNNIKSRIEQKRDELKC